MPLKPFVEIIGMFPEMSEEANGGNVPEVTRALEAAGHNSPY